MKSINFRHLITLVAFFSVVAHAKTITLVNEKGTFDDTTGGLFRLITENEGMLEFSNNKYFDFSKPTYVPDNAVNFIIDGYTTQDIIDGATYLIHGFGESSKLNKFIEIKKN